MTDDFIMKNCTKCRFCRQIHQKMYGCYCNPYKGKWLAEITLCPLSKLKCKECYWYSNVTVEMCEYCGDPCNAEAEACDCFDEKEGIEKIISEVEE